jgi:hypothetical protein
VSRREPAQQNRVFSDACAQAAPALILHNGTATDPRSLMLSKFFAIVLVVLIVTPFTAPFSTYDFHMVITTSTRESRPQRSSFRLEADSSVGTPAAPVVRSVRRTRTPVLTCTGAVSPPGDRRACAIGARVVTLLVPPTARPATLRV